MCMLMLHHYKLHKNGTIRKFHPLTSVHSTDKDLPVKNVLIFSSCVSLFPVCDTAGSLYCCVLLTGIFNALCSHCSGVVGHITTFLPCMSLKVVRSTLDAGKAGHRPHIPSPLMYEWHGTRYLGAAHGLAGILTVLLQVGVGCGCMCDVLVGVGCGCRCDVLVGVGWCACGCGCGWVLGSSVGV